MKPAEELRAAAEKIRRDAEAAHRASPAPWAVTEEHVVRCADGMIVADRSSTDHPAERADLPYIASMSPAVGRALATWLEHEAAGHEAVQGLGDVTTELLNVQMERADYGAQITHSTLPQALAVARAINPG